MGATRCLTRGICKRSFTPGIVLIYQSLVNTGTEEAQRKQPLPTMLETLRSLATVTGPGMADRHLPDGATAPRVFSDPQRSL
ncbi:MULTISPECIES: hypothetical protein [Sinorhizobium]|uniref:hypothetical protein n=1 Tax=Sinorhizobium TaxID=28105 RepID=UPI000BE936F6|nr:MULTISPECIES: hypothetical protein [Sinorhizobium]PDT51598.1 hypothetical protein CO664_20445 [Sinorhizobium sp. NG07B]POH26560.1 hypothetical protein ATY30_24900 [Sinorhizobium americanum]